MYVLLHKRKNCDMIIKMTRVEVSYGQEWQRESHVADLLR